MKIRRKSQPMSLAIWTVQEESESFYIATDLDSDCRPLALSKKLYEPVPDERWEDVTAGCEWNHDSLVHRPTSNRTVVLIAPGCIWPPEYRLSKLKYMYAFIIEKRIT